MNENLNVIDSLRGIAALSVCIFHFVLGHGNYLNEFPLLMYFSSYGWLGVEMFFVISGFVIPYSMSRYDYNLNKLFFFLKKRIIRIEPPYIVSILISVLLLGISKIFLNNHSFNFDFIQIILHLGYLNPFFGYDWIVEYYWTLGVEFQFYIFMGLVFPFFFRNKTTFFLTLILISLFPLLKDNFKTFLSYSTLFCFGFVIYAYKLKLLTFFETIITTFFICIICLYIFKFEQTIIGLITTLLILFTPNFSNKTLQYLGKISFSLYLTHDIIGGRLINLFIKSHYNEYPLLIFLSGIFFAILFATLFYLIFERSSINLAKRIKLNKL
jgi:peptidoglycan/LPS O-acetylase OafA/YrhL